MILPYMLQKLLKVGIHEPGVFLILLFHYTLKWPDGLLPKSGLGNIPNGRGGLRNVGAGFKPALKAPKE